METIMVLLLDNDARSWASFLLWVWQYFWKNGDKFDSRLSQNYPKAALSSLEEKILQFDFSFWFSYPY